MPNAPITFHDAIQGDCGQNLVSEVGDFVIRRTDGYFAYQLAVVVDDADQGITHIVRGSDLLDSTARQIYLQQLLDFPALKYAHLPIAVDQYGYKLSKQTGAEPINADHPGLALWSALRFLGQEAPPELVHALPAEIIAWALTHWRLTKVPTIAHFCAAQLD